MQADVIGNHYTIISESYKKVGLNEGKCFL